MTAATALDIVILGKEYRVGCKPEEADALKEAAELLDGKLREFAALTNAAGEKLAVMTALNLAHELLRAQRGDGFDIPAMKRRISLMNARLETALAQQERLF